MAERVIPEGYCQCGCGQKTRIARVTNPQWGHVRGKPVRYRPGHHNRGRKGAAHPAYKPERYRLEDRGYETPCWIWVRALNSGGYASRSDYRSMYESARGPIPGGLELDHLCQTRSCVNPDHLQVVNHAENVRRGKSTPLTYEAVARIRKLRELGWTQQAIADVYGVTQAAISDIDRGRTWAVPGVAL